MTKA
ncbi:uncharacterized protein FRV6_11766 [Fusarium oxysporum]|jgi:hypothetical protein